MQVRALQGAVAIGEHLARLEAPASLEDVWSALLFHYLDRTQPERGYRQLAVDHWRQAAELVADSPTGPTLLEGFVGVAWVAQHLRETLGQDAEDLNASIDDALLPWLAGLPVEQPFELLYGVVGVGVYALDRLPVASGARCLDKVLDWLERTAQTREGGMVWCRPGTTEVDLGLAHGMPGVVGFLGLLLAAGFETDRVRRLLEPAACWLAEQQRTGTPDSLYPNFVGKPGDTSLSRTAWCYGDPGVSLVLLRAGQQLGRDDLCHWARQLASAFAGRGLAQTNVNDAALATARVGWRRSCTGWGS